MMEACEATIQSQRGLIVNCTEAVLRWGKLYNKIHLLRDTSTNLKGIKDNIELCLIH